MEYNEKEYPGHKEIEMVGEKKQRPCWKIGLNPLLHAHGRSFPGKNAPAFRPNSTASGCVHQLSVIEPLSCLFSPDFMFD